MPVTFNPSAAGPWNSTTNVAADGDAVNSANARLGAIDISDNLAYLTGNRTYDQIRRAAETVANLAALKAIADHRDLDTFIIEAAGDKRLYIFEAGSVVTADDYAVVTPTGGLAGRYHLLNVTPKTTTLRRVLSPLGMDKNVAAGTPTNDFANGRVTLAAASADYWGQFRDLNAGDIITSIEVCGDANVAGGGANVVADFYLYQADLADNLTAVTALGTCTLAAGATGRTVVSAAPLPITLPEGSSNDMIVVDVGSSTGGGVSVYIYWVAINGTRTYITE